MMKKIATIATLAMIAPSALGACAATNNWIATDLGLTATGDGTNAVNAADPALLTCVTQRTAGSCCTTANIATFQTEANTLVSTLETAVTTRDQFIMDSRGDVLNVRDSLNSIQESITKLSGDSASVAASLEAFIELYAGAIETFTEDFDALKAGFLTLQSSRATCFNALVRAQVTIWCTACSEAMTGLDTAAETLSLGGDFATYLANACSAYVASAAEQSTILEIVNVSDVLVTLASALSKLADGDAEGAATEITEFATEYAAITTPTNQLHRPSYAPTVCTTASCDWVSGLFTSGALDTGLATVGGLLTAPTRLLQEAPAGRMLQIVTDPSTESVGVTVDFPENPGNVDNDQNSAVRNGAIACAITALAALF